MQINFFESKIFGAILIIIAGLIILVFVFGLGVYVGARRADYSFRWAQAYHTNFGGPSGGFLGGMVGQGFSVDNGVFGQIIKIDGQDLTINGQDNVERIILVSDKTPIRFQRQTEKLSDLKIGENIVAMGEPNSNGQIQAELIRIMPSIK